MRADGAAPDGAAGDDDGAGARLHEGVFDFTLEVPYRLRLPPAAAAPGGAPLLVALHGKGDQPGRFEAEALDALPAGWALLVPAGPIPRDAGGGRARLGLGASWYVYDGDTPAFRRSLMQAERFLCGLVRRVLATDRERPGDGARLDGSRVALLGFSQGAYLAGMVAVQRPALFRAAVLVGGRLRVEALGPNLPGACGLPVLVLHGADDAAVLPGPSRESAARAREAGLDATYREFPAGHEFAPAMRAAAREWLAARFPAVPRS